MSNDVITLPAPPEAGARGHEAGDLLAGKYELVRMLGSGGMGEVWEAENIHLQSRVALKLVRVASDPLLGERLAVEARAAARIEHHGIVRVLDYGLTQDREPFVVMELVSGESLRAWLDRQGALDAETAVRIALRLVDALEAAHARDVVHRDMKPDNVLLTGVERGRVQPKIIDFGVAKLVGHEAPRALTRAGSLVGSPDYMSPEQVLGEPIGVQADVWALSVTLHELIAGRRPFVGPTVQHVLRAILRDPPPVLPNADAELAMIVQRGLARDPAQRWASARDLGAALGAWLAARGVDDDVGSSIRMEAPDSGAPPSLRAARPSTAAISLVSLAISQRPSAPSTPTRSSPSRRLAFVAFAAAVVLAVVLPIALRRALPHSTGVAREAAAPSVSLSAAPAASPPAPTGR
jgi:serine/threonine-protein kinase